MRTGHNRPDPSFVPSHHGKDDRENEYPELEETVSEFPSFSRVSNHHWCNRRLAVSRVKAYIFQAFLEVACVVPELLDQGWLFLDDLQRCNACACDRGRVRPGEEVASDLVLEVFTEVFRADNISTDASEGFREGSHVNVHLSFKMEVVGYSAAVLAEDTVAVSIVNIRHCIMLLG